MDIDLLQYSISMMMVGGSGHYDELWKMVMVMVMISMNTVQYFCSYTPAVHY